MGKDVGPKEQGREGCEGFGARVTQELFAPFPPLSSSWVHSTPFLVVGGRSTPTTFLDAVTVLLDSTVPVLSDGRWIGTSVVSLKNPSTFIVRFCAGVERLVWTQWRLSLGLRTRLGHSPNLSDGAGRVRGKGRGEGRVESVLSLFTPKISPHMSARRMGLGDLQRSV